MNHQHFSNQISDYLLGLLPAAEQQALESHLAGCPHCRQAVLNQQQFLQTVRTTLAVATRPGTGQLTRLMPPPPLRRRPQLNLMRRSMAGVALLVVLILGGLNWQLGYNNHWRNPVVTVLAVTATHQPTSTATNMASQEERPPLEPTMTPRPAGTPIANLTTN